MIKNRMVIIAGATALVLAAGGSAAYAASASIPDSSGVIHGCYNKGGKLKVIDTATTTSCPKGYTSLDWSKGGISGTVTERKDISIDWGSHQTGDSVGAIVSCPPGDIVLNGGYGFSGLGNGIPVEKWLPVDDSPVVDNGVWSAWNVQEVMTGTPYTPKAGEQANWYLSIFAICAPST